VRRARRIPAGPGSGHESPSQADVNAGWARGSEGRQRPMARLMGGSRSARNRSRSMPLNRPAFHGAPQHLSADSGFPARAEALARVLRRILTTPRTTTAGAPSLAAVSTVARRQAAARWRPVDRRRSAGQRDRSPAAGGRMVYRGDPHPAGPRRRPLGREDVAGFEAREADLRPRPKKGARSRWSIQRRKHIVERARRSVAARRAWGTQRQDGGRVGHLKRVQRRRFTATAIGRSDQDPGGTRRRRAARG
jgi:hypothetical protein